MSVEAASSLAPTPAGERVEAIDTLRGLALLGILVMNITGMAFPFAAYFNPKIYGGPTGLNYSAWVFAHLFFDLKMMGIFSMLFGAGVILMTERAKIAGRPFGRIWYRRTLWLMLIGFGHAYLLWNGDILVNYALCGLFLYLFRNRSVRALVIVGLCFLLFGALPSVGGGLSLMPLRDYVAQVEVKVEAGEEPTAQDQALVRQWNEVRHAFAPTPEEVDETIRTMQGPASGVLKANIEEAISMQAQAIPFLLFWRTMGVMLLGMAFMKAGVFTAERSRGFYRGWVLLGLLLGLPIVAVGIWQWDCHDYDWLARWATDGHYNYFASVLVSMGYIGAAMLTIQSGALSGLRARLAAVGRMALTNYLLQSLIGVSIFYGWGLGLFGSVNRFHLWWFILGIWILQLLYSPWWLGRFRFGPAEWLWRSLTYWRAQPMRRAEVG